MDLADTQMPGANDCGAPQDSQYPDDLVSPISKCPLQPEQGGDDLTMKPMDESSESSSGSGDGAEESAEEEEATHDEIVEPVHRHAQCCFQIQSDEEVMLSPKKQISPPEDSREVSAKDAPPAEPGAGQAPTEEKTEEAKPVGLEDCDQAAQEIQRIMDSDEEKTTTKGVFKDC